MMAVSDVFTVDENKAIHQIRERIENEEAYKCETLYDDLILYKFLKGCNFKVNQAEQMLKKHIKWRKVYQIDRILQDYKPLEVLEKYMSQSFLGYDKEGCPIRYSAAGNVDTEGIFKAASFQDVLKCVVHVIETDIKRAKEQTMKMGKTISQFIYIYDLGSLTISKALNKKNLDSFMLGASLFQDNYPERLKGVYVINAPSFFTIPFTILKSVLAIGLLHKIKVFGSNGWREALLEVIDENVLPAFLGGKKTDPDGNPLCKTFVNHGSPVPEKYYLFNNKADFRNLEGVEKLIIKKQTRMEVDILVEEGGSFIEWEFEVKTKDIGFGLSFEHSGEKSKYTELIPVHRTETPDFPENGLYYCDKPGKYIIVFDNSYSLWTPKEVYFKIFINFTADLLILYEMTWFRQQSVNFYEFGYKSLYPDLTNAWTMTTTMSKNKAYTNLEKELTVMDFSDELSVEEKKAILQLREEIEKEETYKCELLYDDLILYKFLKGWSFKLNKAEEMLKKHIVWRKAHQVDRILQDYKSLEVLDLYLSQNFLGFDKEGCVIRYSAAGNVDFDGILKSVTLAEMLKCVVHLIESDIIKTKEQTKKMGKTISKFVYIYNLENLTIAKALNRKNLEALMVGASLFQDNYPERLKSVYVINAPSFFSLPFAILKSVITIGLLNKIKVFGSHGWKEALLEIIDENVLPAFMGGKRTDPDGNPLCNTFVNHGGLVPEKYYFLNNSMDFKNSKDVRKLTIRKQTRVELNVYVENHESFIEWEFEVNPKDIGFGISVEHKVGDISKNIELIPVHRTETPDLPENGMLYCEKSGKYIVIFDNSYSSWTSKDVFFRILVNCRQQNKVSMTYF